MHDLGNRGISQQDIILTTVKYNKFRREGTVHFIDDCTYEIVLFLFKLFDQVKG